MENGSTAYQTLNPGDRVRVTAPHSVNTNGMTGTVRKGTAGAWGWIVKVELDGRYGLSMYTPDDLTLITDGGA